MRRKGAGSAIGVWLIIVGAIIMMFGAGTAAVPGSVVQIVDITIGGIPAISAALIGVGAIIFLGGVSLTAATIRQRR